MYRRSIHRYGSGLSERCREVEKQRYRDVEAERQRVTEVDRHVYVRHEKIRTFKDAGDRDTERQRCNGTDAE